MQETTALLKKASRPLPKAQIAIVFLIQVCEVINLTVIFPFVSEALLLFNIAREESEIGFYAGAVESAPSASARELQDPWLTLEVSSDRRSACDTGAGLAIGSGGDRFWSWVV
jgi:hypothetical protein